MQGIPLTAKVRKLAIEYDTLAAARGKNKPASPAGTQNNEDTQTADESTQKTADETTGA